MSEGPGPSRPLDVVYVVGPVTEELRYSLRSLRNLPHDDVWISGTLPDWAVNVGHIPCDPDGPKATRTREKLLAACRHPEVSDPFIFFNDDFFVVQPTDGVPARHGGPMVGSALKKPYAQARKSDQWRDGKAATYHWLRQQGIENPLSYEVHTPMVIEKEKMADTIARVSEIASAHYLTAYGNLWNVGGVRVPNAKVTTRSKSWKPNRIWVSTSDRSFRNSPVGNDLRALFPDPSPYEEEHMDSFEEQVADTLESPTEVDETAESPDEKPAAVDRCPKCGKFAQLAETRIRKRGTVTVEVYDCGHKNYV